MILKPNRSQLHLRNPQAVNLKNQEKVVAEAQTNPSQLHLRNPQAVNLKNQEKVATGALIILKAKTEYEQLRKYLMSI
jgi:hypothetical protein